MAYAIMGGLAVATLLTLAFLPALYVTCFRSRHPVRRQRENGLREPPAFAAEARGACRLIDQDQCIIRYRPATLCAR
jgi:hypothetical protein